MTPRTIGMLRYRSAQPGTSCTVDLDLAVGVAHRDRPRGRAAHHHALEHRLAAHVAGLGHAGRLTHVRRLRLGLGVCRLLLGVAALEALDPATGVDELLLARVEGVALRAQLDAQRLDAVERVVNSFPQEQCTWHSTYSGWMSVFMSDSSVTGRR